MIKKYKIVENELGGVSLHTRNNIFLVGLWTLPLAIINIIALILKGNEVLLLLLWVGLSVCSIGLGHTPYRYTKYFTSVDKLHEYIAEKRLKSKPQTFYLD